MPKEERLRALKELQECRESKVIIYCLGDRNPIQIFRTIIAIDVIPYLETILKNQGHSKRISLFLYSTGGNIDTPWPMVNLIREFCDEFEVIIPRKALSAATLISLGANRILMSPFSQISPVDPEGSFLQPDGTVQQIAIEDITGFIDFSKSKVGLTGNQGHIEILRALGQKIEPKILGNINRTHSLIRKLAEGMLSLHLNLKTNKRRVKHIVDNLTQKAYSHNHLIGRREAKVVIGLGDIVQDADQKTFPLMEALFNELEKDLDLNSPLVVEEHMEKAKESPVKIDSIRALIQSESVNVEGKSEITIFPNGQVKNPFKWVQ
jgi:hypothetical protein